MLLFDRYSKTQAVVCLFVAGGGVEGGFKQDASITTVTQHAFHSLVHTSLHNTTFDSLTVIVFFVFFLRGLYFKLHASTTTMIK